MSDRRCERIASGHAARGEQVCIAMWSGPRNLSTTLMRSFGARADTMCSDEPFYAAYLALTGIEHPMREAILAAHETRPGVVADGLRPEPLDTSPRPAPIHYQKHMTHHMVPGIPRGWMAEARHVFLIRHPARVIASYLRKTGTVSLEAIGLPLQLELFREAEALLGVTPLVVDTDGLLRDPASGLERLCAGLGIPYDPSMLEWEPGPKPEDGVWAPHWYDAVWKSSGYGPPPGPLPEVPPTAAHVLERALELYDELAAHSESEF